MKTIKSEARGFVLSHDGHRAACMYVADKAGFAVLVWSEVRKPEVKTLAEFGHLDNAKRWAEDCLTRKAWLDASELPDRYNDWTL